MDRFKVCLIALVGLGACSDEQLRERWYVGEENGLPVYQFQAEVRAGASDADFDRAIAEKAARVCPGKFEELLRGAPSTRQKSYSYPIGRPPQQIWIRESYQVSVFSAKVRCLGA